MVRKSEDNEIEHFIIAERVVINFKCLLPEGHWKIIHDEPRIQILLDNTQPVLEMHEREQGDRGGMECEAHAG